ncbi:MAG: TfoX/Sxy family protein [Oscillospiraceae bacterium]|jgi:TfoX/Sxy family transcriptional regulator of competence genes
MASKPEFVQYVAEQLAGAGTVTYRKMFGEYGLYCNGTIFALVCDNQLFLKITEAGKQIASNLPEVPPYPGAKPYFLIEELENRMWLAELVSATCRALPPPKPKRSRNRNGQI